MANTDGINVYGKVANLPAHDVNIREQNINFGGSANQDCLKHLYVTDPRVDKERIQKTNGGLLRESYRWILDNSDFQRFRDDPQSRLLWIKGDPGKGKTMLLCGIIDELEKQTPNFVCYFFCQGTNSSLNNATAVLRGLIFLLATQQPPLDSLLRKEYEHSGRKLFEDGNAFFALSKILSGILGDPSLTRAYIVIDALDECETGLQQLLELVVQITSASRVKWVVSSRNKHDIERQMKPIDSKITLSLELTAYAGHVSHAVGVYIDDRVSLLESLQNDGSLRDRVRRILQQKAGDTFLWAALVVQELKTVESWDVLDVLEEMPMGLEELYARMMKQIQQLKRRHPEYCRLVLSTATLAYRPLHILELSVLSGLPKDISDHSEAVQTIIRECGSFLTIRDDHVYIVHQSAKDYLSGKGAPVLSSDHPGADRKSFLTSLEATTIVFPSGRAQGHRNIFLRSVEAMSKTLTRDIYGLRDPGFSIDNLKIPSPDPLASVRYSCVFWLDHLRDVIKEIPQNIREPCDCGFRFMEKHFLNWLVSLSLLRKLPDGIVSVRELLHNLQSLPESSSEFHSFLEDAERFAATYRSIMEQSPLQIYGAALVFCPTESRVKRMFWGQHLPFIKNVVGIKGTWDLYRQTLVGHDGWVSAIAFSPNGKMLASASRDKTVRLWAIDTGTMTGELKQTLTGHNGRVNSIAFSSDGKMLASASDDKTVRLWAIDPRTMTGESKQILVGHDDWVNTVAFSPDGKMLASASGDKTVRLWAIDTGTITGELKQTLTGHDWSIAAVAFSPDGKMLASASDDKTVRLWAIDTGTITGELKQTLTGHDWSIAAVAFSPDGKILASASRDKTVRLWAIDTGTVTGELKQILVGHDDWVNSIAFSSDGKILASGSDDKTVRLWAIDTGTITGELKQTLTGHDWSIAAVAFSHDGKMLASASDDKTVRLWAIDPRTMISELRQTFTGHDDWVRAIAFSPDGKMLASASRDKTVRLWATKPRTITGELKKILVGHNARVNTVAFSPDGKILASASIDRTVRLWAIDPRTMTGESKQILVGHDDWVNTVAFSPDGKMLASASGDKTVRLWAIDTGTITGELKQTLKGHNDWVRAVAFSPDGKMLASASHDKTVRLWAINTRTMTGELKQTLTGHDWSIAAVAFSHDGKILASASDDKTVRLWAIDPGTRTGKAKQTLTGYGPFESLSFSEDGSFLNTDRGLISLSEPGQPVHREDPICMIFAKEDWITEDGQDRLFLPADYRATCSAFCNNVLVFGHASGRVTFFEFASS